MCPLIPGIGEVLQLVEPLIVKNIRRKLESVMVLDCSERDDDVSQRQLAKLAAT